MNYIADLHIHSPFSRATSPDCSPAGLAAWARIKGVQIVATGDVTHPGWLSRLQHELEPAEPGLYRLKDESSIPAMLPGLPPNDEPVRFLLSAEISSIYKRHGQTRKVHNLLYLPDFAAAQRLNAKLAGIGNIESDGRPILGLDSRNLLEIMLEASSDAFMVPAHIWTPWFSLFGSKSGFDSIEECFDDLSAHIFALETGLSSDPDMNRLISGLDRCALISNSDCHSPSKLGREANLFNTGYDFFSLRDALKENHRDRFVGTIEFFPEEGKYHFDGHRDCKVCLDPHESRKLGNRCPVCGTPLTIGVHHRVLELADRETPLYRDTAPGFHSLIPLPELLSELLQVGPASRAVTEQYAKVIARFGSEFNLLLHTPLDVLREYEPLLAEAVARMRGGRVVRRPGYDGEFGTIKVFEEGELVHLAGQSSLFGEPAGPKRGRKKKTETKPLPVLPPLELTRSEAELPSGPNQQQQAAIQAGGRRILVAAGPGTGKTFTLISRLARLMEQGIAPQQITAITFTTRAADELHERLKKRCGAPADQVFVGTFHRFCLERLRTANPGLAVVGPEERERMLRRLFPELGVSERSRLSAELAAHFLRSSGAVSEQVQRYIDELLRLNAIDLDAVIPVFVQLLTADPQLCGQVQQQVGYLFVDEFQDLNRSQYDLVQLLAQQAEVFAIGDPDQAIYGFRGSDLRYFFRFAEQPGTVLLSLSTSYRSAPVIVQGASALIGRNLIRSGLPLQSDMSCPPHGVIELHSAPSPAAEAELIVRRIEELLGGIESFSLATGRGGDKQAGGSLGFGDIAVLFRLGRQAEELSVAFNRRGIPFQLVGATPYYLSPELRPAYYFIQAAAGSQSMAEWLALLGTLPGVGATTVQRLDGELPLQGVFFDEVARLKTTAAVKTALHHLSVNLEQFRRSALADGVGSALEHALRYLAVDGADDLGRRLLRLATSFGTDLALFSQHLRQYAAATVYDPRAEAVALMTCHSAKGLEFPVVFMTGLEEGIFPCTLMGPTDFEEERRLFYVGLTRARERVILSAARRRHWVGNGEQHAVSRFISELPAELLTHPEPHKQRRKPQDPTAQMDLF
jgi:uncharacterized protein (TIGR00375 family)